MGEFPSPDKIFLSKGKTERCKNADREKEEKGLRVKDLEAGEEMIRGGERKNNRWRKKKRETGKDERKKQSD